MSDNIQRKHMRIHILIYQYALKKEKEKKLYAVPQTKLRHRFTLHKTLTNNTGFVWI